MKNKAILIIAITVLVTAVVYFVTGKKEEGLVGPTFMQQGSSPTPVPTPNAPKTFQFDASTDLEAELQKVNPEVLDSDFE